MEADGTASPVSDLLFSFERSQSGAGLRGGGDGDGCEGNIARKGSSGDLQHVVALGRPGTEFEQEVSAWLVTKCRGQSGLAEASRRVSLVQSRRLFNGRTTLIVLQLQSCVRPLILTRCFQASV